MNNKNFGSFLTDEAVLEITQQHIPGVVSLVAFDCNWTDGNDASGEKDYFNLWAAVSFHEKKDRIFLHGARFSNWNIEYEMKLIGKVENTGVYRLSLNNVNEFPNEFVIRLERETGEQIYDNNNFRNYYIEHSKGRFTTAIAHKGSIFSFESIIPVKIINS